MTSTQLALEPVGLAKLAEALRDGAWLDMRVVGVGTVERVQIETINVHRERDVIVVEQKWPDGNEVGHTQMAFDAEDVRWVRETQVALEDVTPVLRSAPASNAAQIVDEIIRTVAFLTEGVSEADLRSGGKQTGCVRTRQEAMWLAYEMTDLTPLEIAVGHFGYRSVQPMLTVHHKVHCAISKNEVFHWNETSPSAWFSRVRATRSLVDTNKGERYRRTKDLGPWECAL